MPCKELIELEISFQRLSERRQSNVETGQERRHDSVGGFRAGEAKFAYIVMNHRQTCPVCRAEAQAAEHS